MKIVRTSTVEWAEGMNRGAFKGRRKLLGGGGRLGCSLWELPPGKKSFPLHAHRVTEEGLFVISGHAKVRTPDGETPIGPGDFVLFPTDGPAHQLVNDTKEPMTYLAMSVGQGVDLVEYPDSGKVSLSLGTWPNMKRFIFKAGTQVEYFDGEGDA